MREHVVSYRFNLIETYESGKRLERVVQRNPPRIASG